MTKPLTPAQQRHLEKVALGVLHLRGPHPPVSPALGVPHYEQAVGSLRKIARATGETPAELCRRLGITGIRLRMCIPRDAGGRWRLTADQRRASYRGRDPLRNATQRQQAERRAAILGITLDSPEWLALMASDRAWLAKMKKMRDEAGPPHPMRTKHYAKK